MNTAEFLKQHVGIFADFSNERLRDLAAGSRVVSFEANEAVAHQGDEATHFGVVLSGTLNAAVLGDAATRHALGQLKSGDTFGEMAMMTGDPLPADFIAESRCEVLLIPVALFQSLIMADPGAIRKISRTIAERMKTIMADPVKAAAALRQGDDPYGFKLKGERPEKILVINCGSSSLKYSFYDTADESHHAGGGVERIGLDGTRIAHRGPRGEVKRELPKAGFAEAFTAMLAELTAKETGAIGGAGEVSVVAHRVVHGGEAFTETTGGQRTEGPHRAGSRAWTC
jgi:acetate kinase